MAHVKNTNRSKRKYGDAQKQRTARNRTRRVARHESRLTYFANRLEAMKDRRVLTGGQQGQVTDILYDQSELVDRGRRFSRAGRVLEVKLDNGKIVHRLRKSVKLV